MTIFKAMGRESTGLPKGFRDMLDLRAPRVGTDKCDECGAVLFDGDWPFCKGEPADHRRD